MAGTGFVEGTTQEVVLAGGADSRVVRLAMLHDDDGCPDHFDVLTPVEDANMVVEPTPLQSEGAAPREEDEEEEPTAAVERLAHTIVDSSLTDAAEQAQAALLGPSDRGHKRSGSGSWRDWALGFVACTSTESVASSVDMA